jgi:hypothetical protein
VLANMTANAKNQIPSSKKPRIVTAKQKKARAQNMRDYRASVGGATNQKHGVNLVINTGGKSMPAILGASEIREGVEALIAQAEQDLGGPDQITASQRCILQSQKLCLLILGLGSHYLASEGVVNRKTGKAQALLGTPRGLRQFDSIECLSARPDTDAEGRKNPYSEIGGDRRTGACGMGASFGIRKWRSP